MKENLADGITPMPEQFAGGPDKGKWIGTPGEDGFRLICDSKERGDRLKHDYALAGNIAKQICKELMKG